MSINTEELQRILSAQLERYPKATVQDIVKLLYQNEFGGGHYIEDVAESLSRMEKESITSIEEEWRTESIGNQISRLYLPKNPSKSALKIANEIFVLSANRLQGRKECFEKKLDFFLQEIQQRELPFSYDDSLDFLKKYRKEGHPMVSHSDTYVQEYKPAYRVVEKKYADFFSIYLNIAKALAEHSEEKPFVLAIEGGSASGKTTLAQSLVSLFNASVISMDHFFLQEYQRTAERFQEPGGNVDYERFEEQIVQPILEGQKNIDYPIFDCSIMDFTDEASIIPRELLVVEGAYCAHPKITPYWDILLFLETSAETQKERLMKRNTTKLVQRFTQEWIPMEKTYFTTYQIKKKADFSLYIED